VKIEDQCCATLTYSDNKGYYELRFRGLQGEAQIKASKKGMRIINESNLRFIPKDGITNKLDIYLSDSLSGKQK
jgi:hypothetical protein